MGLGILQRLVGMLLWGPIANRVSVSMSNVPGPQFPLEWCSIPVDKMMFLLPPTGRISLFLTIATWDGKASVGMAVDGTLLSQEALRRISALAGALKRYTETTPNAAL